MATFTNYEAQQIYNTLRRKELNISGITGYGYEFNTNCKLTVNDADEPAIYENFIVADFIDLHNLKYKQADVYAQLNMDILDINDLENALYIDTIKVDGRTICENEDFNNIKRTVLEAKRIRERKLRSTGQLIEPTDKKDFVTEAINKYNGNLIAIKNTSKYATTDNVGVLIGCEKYAKNGAPVVALLDGLKSKTCTIGTESTLFSVHPNGKMRLVESSGNVTRLREKIADRIKKFSGGGFGRF